MNKQELANIIWESANQMRSTIEANEYKDYILGFMFYKYLSDREINFLKSEKYTDEDIKNVNEKDKELVNHIKQNLGYFIAYDHLFSTWIEKGNNFDVTDVRDALNEFSFNIEPTYKNLFENIFNTLQTGLSKLGGTPTKQTKSIKDLLNLIRKIPMSGKQNYDVLGFIYEYLISMFAANAGKKAGEFYTPHEVSILMSEIVSNHVQGRKHLKIYDPTSGSGSLLINLGKVLSQRVSNENKIDYYAQELKENTYNLTRMNLLMRGINPANIYVRNGDTLDEDWPFFENDQNKDDTYKLVKVDAVVSNPPYSQQWDSKDKEFDPRFKEYGLAPSGNAEYAFLLHELYHLKDDGIMTIVLPHGVLFRKEEQKIREALIECNHIEAIISLPSNLFFGTSIPTIIMVLKKHREDSDVLIIDASKNYEKSGKKSKLRARDVRQITDVIRNKEEIDKFSKLVTKEEIVNNDYNLNIPRYVGSAEMDEQWDLYSVMFGKIPKTELSMYQKYWDAFTGVYEEIFTEESKEYVNMINANITDTISNFPSVKKYCNKYKERFDGFQVILKQHLIDDILDVNANKILEIVWCDILKRLEKDELVDKYQIFQILQENWDNIITDLEIIQSEGFDSVFKVDPNMVLKKKKNEKNATEVQEGWKGRILPFELVQKELLETKLKELCDIEFRLNQIQNLYVEILDSLEQDKLDSSIVNEDNSAFVPKRVKEYVKKAVDNVVNDEIVALKEYLSLPDNKKKKLDYISETKVVVDWSKICPNKDGVTYGKPDVRKRITELQMKYEFPQGSFDGIMKKVVVLMDEETNLKKIFKTKKQDLILITKDTIEKLDDERALVLLELKWIKPIIDRINDIPNEIVDQMISDVNKIKNKYALTYKDIVEEKTVLQESMLDMIGNLTGDYYDFEALEEFKKLIKD